MREKAITGKYIGNAIGYCHCKAHTGALNKELAYKHKSTGFHLGSLLKNSETPMIIQNAIYPVADITNAETV